MAANGTPLGIEAFISLLAEKMGADVVEQNVPTMNRWLEEGRTIAVYENNDMGHPSLGDVHILSFAGPEIPERMPDTESGKTGWRYTLIGTYYGPALPAEITASPRTLASPEHRAALAYAEDLHARGYTSIAVFNFVTSLDNREPHHRNHQEVAGFAVRYTSSDEIDAQVYGSKPVTAKWKDGEIMLFCNPDGLKQDTMIGNGAIVDIPGEDVAPYRTGSWSPASREGVPNVLMSRFPTSHAGSTWSGVLGPRTYFHLVMMDTNWKPRA